MTAEWITTDQVRKILSRYDPENDLPPTAEVTWAEHQLAEALTTLAKRVDELEQQLQQYDHREISARGGRAKTDAKVNAARTNGRRGGRPKNLKSHIYVTAEKQSDGTFMLIDSEGKAMEGGYPTAKAAYKALREAIPEARAMASGYKIK